MPHDYENSELVLRGLQHAAKNRNSVSDELQSILESRLPGQRGVFDSTPNIQQHPRFRGTPPIPNPMAAQAMEALQRIAPQLPTPSRLDLGPTKSFIHDLNQSNIPVEKYDMTEVVGQYSPVDKDIFVSPMAEFLPGGVPKTIAHEMAHSGGIGHGREMENIEGLVLMLRDAQALREGLKENKRGWFWD